MQFSLSFVVFAAKYTYSYCFTIVSTWNLVLFVFCIFATFFWFIYLFSLLLFFGWVAFVCFVFVLKWAPNIDKVTLVLENEHHLSVFDNHYKFTYIYMYTYNIYIYSHPQTDCFVLSELFSVARHAGGSLPESKPVQLYDRLRLQTTRPQADYVG